MNITVVAQKLEDKGCEIQSLTPDKAVLKSKKGHLFTITHPERYPHANKYHFQWCPLHSTSGRQVRGNSWRVRNSYMAHPDETDVIVSRAVKTFFKLEDDYYADQEAAKAEYDAQDELATRVAKAVGTQLGIGLQAGHNTIHRAGTTTHEPIYLTVYIQHNRVDISGITSDETTVVDVLKAYGL